MDTNAVMQMGFHADEIRLLLGEADLPADAAARLGRMVGDLATEIAELVREPGHVG